MIIGKPTKSSLAIYAVLSFLLSGLMFYSWATFRGLPQFSQLRRASGTVAWAEDGRYGIKFGLEHLPGNFDYSSKGNAMGLVYSTLTRKDKPTITVYYDPSSASGPLWSNDKYFSVYQLEANGEPFRTHQQIESAWRSDEKVGLWLSVLMLLGGIYLSVSSVRHKRAT